MAAMQVNDSVSTSFLVSRQNRSIAVYVKDLQGKCTLLNLPPPDAVHAKTMHVIIVAHLALR